MVQVPGTSLYLPPYTQNLGLFQQGGTELCLALLLAHQHEQCVLAKEEDANKHFSWRIAGMVPVAKPGVLPVLISFALNTL